MGGVGGASWTPDSARGRSDRVTSPTGTGTLAGLVGGVGGHGCGSCSADPRDD